MENDVNEIPELVYDVQKKLVFMVWHSSLPLKKFLYVWNEWLDGVYENISAILKILQAGV